MFTKDDAAAMRAEMKADAIRLELKADANIAEMKADMKAMRAEMKADSIRAELKADANKAEMKAEMRFNLILSLVVSLVPTLRLWYMDDRAYKELQDKKRIVPRRLITDLKSFFEYFERE